MCRVKILNNLFGQVNFYLFPGDVVPVYLRDNDVYLLKGLQSSPLSVPCAPIASANYIRLLRLELTCGLLRNIDLFCQVDSS